MIKIKNNRGTRVLTSYSNSNLVKSKRSQVTVFIIIAILLVAAVILIFWLYNRALPDVSPSASKNPEANIEQCVNEHVKNAVDNIFENGGYVNKPKNQSKILNGEEITYLCYNAENYARCIVIEPVFIEHIEDEIYNNIKSGVANCIASFEKELRSENYDVTSSPEMSFSVNLIPEKVEVIINKKITIKKTGETRTFKKFNANYNSPLYDIAIIVQEIVRQESMYCNSEYIDLMRLNTDFEIIKFQTGDDNKIYTIKDLKTKKEIKFAVRGCVFNTPS